MSIGIKFLPWEDGFTAAIRLRDVFEAPESLQHMLDSLAACYEMRIRNMRLILEANRRRKRRGQPVLATSIWGLGNRIFLLMRDMKYAFVEVEDLYGHLERDLGLSRNAISRIVTLRRYVPRLDMLPPDLKWDTIAPSPKRFAAGLHPPEPPGKNEDHEDPDSPPLFTEP
jgi:hypothetical protein